RAALIISKLKGVDVSLYDVTEKGVAIGAHGIRSEEDYPGYESYACSVQAGDHTSVARFPLDHGNSELRSLLYDTGVFCWFNFFEKEAQDLLWPFIEAVTGWRITEKQWIETVGRRILHIQRALLLLGGPDLQWVPLKDDDVPLRWYTPLGAGPYKGKAVDRERLNRDRKEYYEAIGWDENGVPLSTELRRLGLQDVDVKLDEIRKNLPK
ncbi:MAG: aldehyde ferredoxin oxidoreductase C-terminal domain-containing protein, partial [Candidatus Bathyarchaeia archaeon]